jgi:chemotaxis protein MotB
VIAKQLRDVNNPIVIEGHTDSLPLVSEPHYSNWELSADRANAARRAMEASGLRPRQVLAVRGYADRKPLRPRDPRHYSNRRVSILVAYSTAGY